MIDVVLALAALLGVSLLALSCCGPPGSSKLSCNGSSHDRVETTLDRGGSRKITVIAAENINHDVKEKTLEDERKKTRERINRSRAAKSNNRSNQEQLPRRRSRAREDHKDGSDSKQSEKGGGGGRGGGGGVRRKAKAAEKDAARLVSSSDPYSKQSDAKKVEKDNDGEDLSTKEGGMGGNSKTPMDDSQKGGSRVGSGLPSTERVGTNETMVSRERADEVESAKLKKEREAKTPGMQSLGETQMDSDSKKPKLKTPPKPKRRQSKRKEEEVRQWNEAIARGNVFRPRKDDETVDEVHVDWNG